MKKNNQATIDLTLEEAKIAYMVFLNMSMNKLPLKTVFGIKKILMSMESYIAKSNEVGEELKNKYKTEIETAQTEGETTLKELEAKINQEYIEWLRSENITVTYPKLPASAIENIELSLGSANAIEKFLDLDA